MTSVRPLQLTLVAASGIALLALVLLAAAASGGQLSVVTFAALAIGIPGAYLVTRFDPAYSMTAVIILSSVSGSWQNLGIPGPLALNRLLLVLTIAAVVLRIGGARDRPAFKVGAAHWALLGAGLYAVGSALVVDNLFDRASFFALIEAYGLLPFLTFLIAPVVFATQRQRNILLAGLVGFGLYLAVTAVLERAHIYGLVFPRYIADPNVGIHFGQARGPFVQATLDGFALFVCAVASAIAALTWKRQDARVLAGGIAGFCLVATVLTFQRNVWLGALLGTFAILFFARGRMRAVAPGVAALGAVAALLFIAVPALFAPLVNQAGDRATVDDRVNADRAALNMIAERPLLGFGWNQWERDNALYFELGRTTAYSEQISKLQLHSTWLGNAVEFGLVGLAIWVLAIILGLAGAIGRRAPPGDLGLWRSGLIGIATFWLVTMNFVPTNPFSTLLAWLCIGVVWARYYDTEPLGSAELAVPRDPGEADPPSNGGAPANGADPVEQAQRRRYRATARLAGSPVRRGSTRL